MDEPELLSCHAEMAVAPPCQTCGTQEASTPSRPPWATIRGFEDCAVWQDAERLPLPGDSHRLRVRYPFRARSVEPLWVLFRPALSALNGWDDHPDELPASGIVECVLREDLGPSGRRHLIRVQVLRAVPLGALPSAFPAGETPAVAPLPAEPQGMRGDVLRWGDFTFCEWSAQSSVGEWTIYQHLGDRHALTLSAAWGIHHSVMFAGCRILTPAEAAARGL